MINQTNVNPTILNDANYQALDIDSQMAVIKMATNPDNDVDGHLVIDKNTLSSQLSWPYEKTAWVVMQLIKKHIIEPVEGNAQYSFFIAEFTNPDWVNRDNVEGN